MYTQSKEIVLSESIVQSKTPITMMQPFTVDISENPLNLKLESTSSGNEWRDDEYLIMDLEFRADSRTFIEADFYTDGERIIRLNYSIIPNRRIKIAFPLCELKSQRWYLTPHPGNLKGHVDGKPTHISEIDSVCISTSNCRRPREIVIYSMYLSEALPDFTVVGEPMVDRFGQNREVEFYGKFHSERELCEYLRSEYKSALENGGYADGNLSEYGGYMGLKFDKTGAFHTHFDGRRWWLVDPDGYAFLSKGVCYGSRMGVHGFVDGMENLFEWLPRKDDDTFADAWTTADNIPEFVKRNGKEAGSSRYMFNFARANMIRAFGDDWWNAWCTINSARLKRWGFNTISVCVNNYFDENVYEYLKKARIPYTWTLKNFPRTKEMIFRDFPDVFSPEYRKLCSEFAKQLEPLAGDKYMIGYFINNEPEWLVARRTNIAEELIKSEKQLYSKHEFIRFIKEKYQTPQNFANAWGLEISDFNELLNPVAQSFEKNNAAECDLNEFRDILIAAYNKIPLDEVKKYSPDGLCLGMRYAYVEKGDLAGGDYFDSFSFNCYRGDPTEQIQMVAEGTNVPFMIGEWHIGASDTDLLCSALVTCADEEERGKACSEYILRAFSNPRVIGAHYFEYNDQPLLGRFDGEAMPHGLIDVCNRPHECVKYIARANQNVYSAALESVKPDGYNAEFLPSF